MMKQWIDRIGSHELNEWLEHEVLYHSQSQKSTVQTKTSASKPVLARIFVALFFAIIARSSSANLILYIDDPSTGSGTQTYEVVLMDGKVKGYEIQNTDTTFSGLWGHFVTADDVDENSGLFDSVPNGRINISSAGLGDVNGRFADFEIGGDLTAYTNIDGLGGRELHTKVTAEGLAGTRKELRFAATYDFTFNSSPWYYWHSASGFATDGSGSVGDELIIVGDDLGDMDPGNDIPAMTTFGGVDDSGQDFTLTHFYGGTPNYDPLNSGNGQYALPNPPDDGNVYFDGVGPGLYTMTANFSVYLGADQKLQFQSTTYAITPEPASIAVWVLGGLVVIRRKVCSVAVRIKSSIS
jgi:hypothetical protein